MDHVMRVALLLLLLAKVYPSSSAYDYEHCKATVKQWAASSLQSDANNGHILKDLLFFLHVPRTGGRTYFYCFLKKLYSSSLECPRSYDKLRFDPRTKNCRLLSTHDDYSIMSKLPTDKTSVVTMLRNPVDRVFSAYEFSIEVAARFLVHSNLTSARKISKRVRLKNGVISTLEIWPWKYLVPWMMGELFARRDSRKEKGPPYAYGNDSYNMEEIVMPLHEFINHPVTLDIVHNGATFQVAGLTNNSNVWEVHDVRHCVMTYQNLGKYVLKVAKKRLDNMLYVGLTEEHRESATMFANLVGTQVISQLAESNPVTEAMTVEKLMGTYETCVSKLRSTQSKRRINSFKKNFPANFTKEARRYVSETVLKQITLLNSLDVDLYKHAQKVFIKQHQVMEQKLLDNPTPGRWQIMLSKNYTGSTWEILCFFLFIFLLFFICLYVKSKLRKSKLKI
ncbi:protein-tyrosine sulfotransferase-like [Rutidosis leptorrhynchoides]|uniref:protein-tyrosine sulfotransferase-like n=1 Tax=Rutidosis leptorrhynchoides TaxID=125765 RepID=UPI003A99E2BA